MSSSHCPSSFWWCRPASSASARCGGGGAEPRREPRADLLPITLPLLAAGRGFAGGLFAFTISFDDITGTLFWKPGGVETVPTQIFAMLRNSISPEINALGTVMIVLTVGLPLLGAAIARRMAMQARRVEPRDQRKKT
jgi:ABC-type spermidine/putrescine transport system permease subunit II